MGVIHADSGMPQILNGTATAEEKYFDCVHDSRALSLRNTGGETLWVSPDRKEWFDIPAGTSWGSHSVFKGFWHCTQLGETTFVVNHVDLGLSVDPDRRGE